MTLGTSAKLSDFVGNDGSDLLLWRDPVRSGLALSGATGLYVLLAWTSWSLITIISTFALVAVGTSYIWAKIATFFQRAGPPVPAILREGVSEGQIKRLVEQLTPLLNKALAVTYRLATGKDLLLTVQVAGVLFAVNRLSSLLSILSTLYLVALLAFSVPKLYELKKTEIDAAIKEISSRTKALYDEHAAPLVAKIPRASSATAAKADASPAKASISPAKVDAESAAQPASQEDIKKTL